MAPPLNSQDDRAAFLDACINKRKKPIDVWESLGLISEKSHDKQNGHFVNKDKADQANELQRMVEGIAKSFATSYRGNNEELHSYLAEEDVFLDDVLRLGREYGVKIWGRIEEGELRSSGESQGHGIDEQDWDDAKDRKNILFYIRCWIISIVVKEYKEHKPTPRRGKGKGVPRDSGSFGDQPDEDTVASLADSNNPTVTSALFRAPEPRMYPTPEPRREATCTSASRKTTGTFFSSANKNTSPSKRKAQDSHERVPFGKLPKPSKSARTVPVLTQEPRDPYSIPVSPPAFPNLNHSFERRRETTYDADETWMPPREETADTETVVDAEEVDPAEVDARIQNDVATSNSDDMQYSYSNDNAVGPSGTYRNPLRQDSVIPNDTQPQSDTHPSSTQPNQDNEDTPSSSYTSAIIRSLITSPTPTPHQTRTYRLELFKLLIAYLNNISPFDPCSYDSAAEERMDLLLNQFHCTDVETWYADHDHNDGALRLHLAYEKWMGMRHRLAVFRSATGYFGGPGGEWEEWLRGREDGVFAKAVLAFVALKEGEGGHGGGGKGFGEGFDADVMVVFDGLTRVRDCTGPEAFKGVRRFNEGLVGWFEDA